MTEFFLLIWEFFKTGLFAVGGGLATIPFLYDMCGKYDWFTEADLADMIAVSESTPGPIGINMATYAGYNAFGIPGALCATLALVTPSVIIICLIARFLTRFSGSTAVSGAFSGIRPAVPGLILAASVPIFSVSVLSLPASTVLAAIRFDALGVFIIVAAAFALTKKVHPIFFILFGALCGILLRM